MYNSVMNTAIIGAGPSGMAAALAAAHGGGKVVLFERNEQPGKKLQVTGSGRCNLSNEGVSAARYAGPEPEWMAALLAHFSVATLLDLLRGIGVLTYHTSDGWYYPLSESAPTVARAFASALAQSDVELRMPATVTGFAARSRRFRVTWTEKTGRHEEEFDRLVVAAGGKAYPTLGSRGELFACLEQLGHTVIPLRPALAPVLADLGAWKALRGQRLDVEACLMEGARVSARAAGNLIITDWGFNGPAVMDISHAVNSQKKQSLGLNLLYFYEDTFQTYLAEQRSSTLPVEVFLGAFFSPKVVSFLLEYHRIPESTLMKGIPMEKWQDFMQSLRGEFFPVKGVRGFEYCQTTAGGVPAREVNPETLESLQVPHLYLIGETLDVVGPCGGYNLHYAFASGTLAGRAIHASGRKKPRGAH